MESNVSMVGPNQNYFIANFKRPDTENSTYYEFGLILNLACTASPIIVNIIFLPCWSCFSIWLDGDLLLRNNLKKISQGMKLKLERQELCSAVRRILLCHLIEVLLLLCAPVFPLNKLNMLQYIGCYFFHFYSWAVLGMFRLYQNEKIWENKRSGTVFTRGINIYYVWQRRRKFILRYTLVLQL